MYQLFDYQKDIIRRARKALAKGDHSVLIQSPAGSGKSIVIAEIARRTVEKGNHLMFMVHRKELVDQITQSFQKQGVDLSKCTIMTVGKIKNRLGKLPYPQLLITDETHHGLAKTYRKIYDYYHDVPRLGFTATPWRMNGSGLNEIYQDMVEGKTVDWLIEHRFLAQNHYWTVDSIDHQKLKTSNKNSDYTNDSIDDSFGKEIFGDVVEEYRHYADGQKTIVYAHSIKYSRLIAGQFKQSGINAVHVDSKTPPEQREKIMQDFKTGKIQILCNVDLISEGFDVPDCSCVIMVRPTKSLVLFIQQSMRCMRSDHKGPNGTNGTKEATIIDMVGNAHTLGLLPQSDYDWQSSFYGHPKPGKAPTQCQNCMATFYPTKSQKRKAIVDEKEKTVWKTYPIETDSKILFDWIDAHKMGKAVRQIICPVCGQVADELLISKHDSNEGKEIVKGKKYIDLSDPTARKIFELKQVANKSTRKLCRPKSIYAVFDARKQVTESRKNPLFQTLYVLMSKADGHKLTSKQLEELAQEADTTFTTVRSAYIWAQQKWTFNDAPQYNFNF